MITKFTWQAWREDIIVTWKVMLKWILKKLDGGYVDRIRVAYDKVQ